MTKPNSLRKYYSTVIIRGVQRPVATNTGSVTESFIRHQHKLVELRFRSVHPAQCSSVVYCDRNCARRNKILKPKILKVLDGLDTLDETDP